MMDVNLFKSFNIVMPNQVLNLIQDLRLRRLIWALAFDWHLDLNLNLDLFLFYLLQHSLDKTLHI